MNDGVVHIKLCFTFERLFDELKSFSEDLVHTFNLVGLRLMGGSCSDDLNIVVFKEFEDFRTSTDCSCIVTDNLSWDIEFCEDAFETFDNGGVYLILDGNADEKATVKIHNVEGGCHLSALECLFLFEYHKIHHPHIVGDIREWNTALREDFLIRDSMESASSTCGAHKLNKSLCRPVNTFVGVGKDVV